MNETLRYGVRLVGYGYLMDYVMDRLVRGVRRRCRRADPVRLSSREASGPSILYVYDEPDCAIHNVGKCWFRRQVRLEVDGIDVWSLRRCPAVANRYDYIWFGFLGLRELCPVGEGRCMVTVHDPVEIYPDRADWIVSGAVAAQKVDELRLYICVATTSKQMEDRLVGAGVDCSRIPTASTIPACEDLPERGSEAFRILSVGKLRRRKQPELALAIKSGVMEKRWSDVTFTYRWQSRPLGVKRYVRLLDRHQICVCTSYSEGGPLPAMDAMARGAVVLTTPVGQIQEMIADGVNGWVCKDRAEFLLRLQQLYEDRPLMQRMRHESLRSIRELRSREVIERAVEEFAGRLTCQERR